MKNIKKVFAMLLSLLLFMSIIPTNLIALASSDCTLYASFLDSETNAPIPNLTFELYNDLNEKVATGITTNETNRDIGNLRISNLNEGIYYLRLASKSHFITDSDIKNEYDDENGFMFLLSSGENTFIKGDNYKSLTGIKGNVVLTKTISGISNLPKNVEFDLYKKGDSENVKIGTYNTKETNQISINNLTYGQYYFVEVSAPEPLIVDSTPIEFKIETNDETVNLNCKNEYKCSVELIKSDSNNADNKLEGVEFDLYSNSDTPQLIGHYTTNTDGKINVDLPAGSYYFVETETLPNYEINTNKQYFELNFDNYHKIINLSNSKYPEITIKKIDKNNNYVSGATLAIYKDDTLVQQFVTNESDYKILLEPDEYVLKEINAPDGYAKADDVVFTVNSEENKTVTMYNEKINIGISKYKTGTTEYLAGAELSLLDENKSVICQWTSGDSEYLIDSINPGTYYIHEDVAPEGYRKSEDVKIEIESISKKQSFNIYNELIIKSINIKKVDSVSQLALSGAKFELYNNDDKINEWTSDLNYKNLQLQVGTYSIKETFVPDGYVSDGKDTVITVCNDETVIIAHGTKTNLYNADETVFYDIENKPIQIKIYKIDKNTNVKLNDANLSLSNNNGYSENFLSSSNGTLFSGIAVGSYTITEMAAPSGYKIAKPITIEVKATDKIQEFYIEDEMLLGQINITKTGEILKNVSLISKFENYIVNCFNWITGTLSNVTFELYANEDIPHPDGVSEDIYSKNEMIKTLTTGLDGTVVFDNLPIGEYYVKEVSSQTGYIYNENPIYFNIVEINNTVEPVSKTINNDYKTVSVSLSKTSTDNNAVENALYGIYSNQDIFNSSTEKVLNKDDLIDVEKTDLYGKLEFNLKLPKGKYYIKEIKAPDGYVLSTNIFELDLTENNSNYKNNTDKVVRFNFNDTDDYIKISIDKIDNDNKSSVPGAVLRLINQSTGNIIDEWVSSNEPKVFNKIPEGTYILKEINSPIGYDLNTIEKEIIVESKSELQKFEFVNYKTLGSIKITKVEKVYPKLPISGVTFKVYSDDIDYQRTVTTDSNGQCIIDNLPVGIYKDNVYEKGIEYRIQEIDVPEGYLISQKCKIVNFNLSENYPDKSVEKEVTIVNKCTHLAVAKIEANTKEKVVGAKLDIYKFSDVDQELNPIKNATPLYSGISSNNTYDIDVMKIPIGKYVLIESETPTGYVPANPIIFEVKDTENLQVIEMINDYTKLQIYKKDKTTKENISGAKLRLENEKGEIIDEWTSSSEAKTFTKLPIGKYTLIEVEAPNGYRPTENIEFEIAETTKTQTVEMFDEPDVYDFNISKIDYDTGDILSGAKLELYNNNNELIDKWTSNTKGHLVRSLTPGYYYIHEESAPNGYCKSEDMGFEVKENDVNQNTDILFENKSIIVDIFKLDSITNKPLPGAKLHIEDEEGNVLFKWTSTKEAYRITKLNPGAYFLVEDEPPKGYESKTEYIKFIVKETSKIQKIKIYNDEITEVVQIDVPRSPKTNDTNPYLFIILIFTSIIGIFISKKHLK